MHKARQAVVQNLTSAFIHLPVPVPEAGLVQGVHCDTDLHTQPISFDIFNIVTINATMTVQADNSKVEGRS